MHKVGTEDSDIMLEPRENRLTDAQSLDRGLIGGGEKVLIVRRGVAKDVAKKVRNSQVHGCAPLSSGRQRQAGRAAHVVTKYCIATPGSGGDIEQARAQATPVEGGYRISGEKRFGNGSGRSGRSRNRGKPAVR